MAESEFLRYQDANGDGLIDVCEDIIEVNEEFCPGCIPNACATVPIWQNRRKWEPFLNEKICKYQITKGTPRTTTDPEEETKAPAYGVEATSAARENRGSESDTSFESGWLDEEPTSDPKPLPGGSIGDTPPEDLDPGQLESIAATDEDTGGLNYKIFDEYADEIVEALLAAYNKDQSENSKNIVRRYLEYTDWDLKPRPMSRLKLLYSVPYEVLQSIAEAEEEEEEVDTSDIEVSFTAEDLDIKLIRVRKGLNLYDRYRRVFQKIEKSGIYYLNPEAGKSHVFNLEDYGDNGFGGANSLMGQVWGDLKTYLKGKDYYLTPGGIRSSKKKVGRVTFTFTYDYKIKKIVIYTEACPYDPIVVDGKKRHLAQRSDAYSDVTAMAYLARLPEMETDLIARTPLEWTEFLIKYTRPEIYVTSYPEELYEGGEIAACIGEALAAEGKQIGEDILDVAFSLGDAIAHQWHEHLCSTSEAERELMKEKLGQHPPMFRRQYVDDETGDVMTGESVFNPHLSAAAQEEIVKGYAESAQTGAPTSVLGMAKMQKYGYVEENPMLFDFLCTWLGGEGAGAYFEDLGEVLNRLKLCGLLDMLAQVIQCLTGGLTLEEALASIIKATFQGMSIDSFEKFFIGLSAEEQAELDAMVKEKLDSGDIFQEGTNMADASDGIVGNYDPEVAEEASPPQAELDQAKSDALQAYRTTDHDDVAAEFAARRAISATTAAAAAGQSAATYGTGWQGFSSFYENTIKGVESDDPSYDYSGYGGMTQEQYQSSVEQSRRTLAPSFDGGDSWTEYFAGSTATLSEDVVIEAYAKALLEKFEGMELDLVDKLNTLPGAPLVASIIASTQCPMPPFMEPNFVDIIKDFELPWVCGREFVWPLAAFENPFKNLIGIKDFLSGLFKFARAMIEAALWKIFEALQVKLCQLIGETICRALELTGDVVASLATGNRDGLKNVIRESICGPDVADEMLDQTIVDMVALMGDAGAAMADPEYVLELAQSVSALITEKEQYNLFLGNDAGDSATIIATYLTYEYPEFPALHNERGVKSMFKNMGNLMPLDFRDNLQKFVDAAPASALQPANPTLCATPEQIEQFCETRAMLLQNRASPAQIQKMCDDVQKQTRSNLEDLTATYQDPNKHIVCNMPPLVSDPGCDNGILPYEPEETITSTTSMLGNQLESLKSDFSTDMLGNGPFEKNWGMVNMILSDTMASPLTVHHRKASNGWPSADYVNFYTLDEDEVEGEGGKLWQQKGAYPLLVAGWLREQLLGLTPEYKSNNELQDAFTIVKDFDAYADGPLSFGAVAGSALAVGALAAAPLAAAAATVGAAGLLYNSVRQSVDFLDLPDFGYNIDIRVSEKLDHVEFIKKPRKATPDLSLLFEDNEQGRRSNPDEPFNWGFQLEFYNSDLIVMEDPETGFEIPRNEPNDKSRIKIHTYDNQKSNIDTSLVDVIVPSVRNGLSRLIQTSSIIHDMKYEFVAFDGILEKIDPVATLSQYPEFMGMFEDTRSQSPDYSPPVILLHEMLRDSGASFSKSEVKERYDNFMSQITQVIISDVGSNEPGFDYGADFDSLTWDEVEYVVDDGQTESPGGTLYGDAEMPHEDDPSKMRPVQNVDQILGISRMEYLIKTGQKEGENRVYYLDPTIYGGNYMSPPLHIKPLKHKGWLGFVDVLFPELSPCKPQKSDLVDFGEIQDMVTEAYPTIPEDERIFQHQDCSQEWPYGRILDRNAAAGLQGLITAAIRIYATSHFIKSMATFTKFSPKFPEVFSSLYASYVVENMEESFKEASYKDRLPFKDDEFWYGFLEQSVQMYARRVEAEEIEAPSHVLSALSRLNDVQEEWHYPTRDDRKEDHGLHETNRLFVKNYRYDKVLEAVRRSEEDAKIVLTEMVVRELNYMGEKFVSNLDVVEMVPDVFDLDYYLLENLTQGCESLSIDHEIKLTYPNLPTEEGTYYTDGAEFVVLIDNDLDNEYYVGAEYVGYYVVYINSEGNVVFLAGEDFIEQPEETDYAPSTATESEYVQDVLTPIVNQTSVDIGDVAEYEYDPVSDTTDSKPFRLEKYIKVGERILSPTDALVEISLNSDLALNISDVYPGPDGNKMRLVEDEEGGVVGVTGELGVRYGLMFSIVIDGTKYEITSVEVDALDLPLSEFKTIEANSKLLLCLINHLKADDKFKLISKYIFPLFKITATTAIYNDMAFLKSIGEITVPDGDTWSWTSAGFNNAGKPGRYAEIITDTDGEGNEYVSNVDVWGNVGWAAIGDRTRTTTFLLYDDWAKEGELLINSKRQIKRLFKSYYKSRDFAPYGDGSELGPGAIFLADLKARLVPMPGKKLLPWWKKRKLRTNPFNADGELCENED